jgi:hypothetical protein
VDWFKGNRHRTRENAYSSEFAKRPNDIVFHFRGGNELVVCNTATNDSNQLEEVLEVLFGVSFAFTLLPDMLYFHFLAE